VQWRTQGGRGALPRPPSDEKVLEGVEEKIFLQNDYFVDIPKI